MAKYKYYDGTQWVELLRSDDISAWAKSSTKPSYTLDEVSDGSTRKLANYLPKSGGTMTGAITLTEQNSIWNTANIKGSATGSTIGFNTSGQIGFQANTASGSLANAYSFRVGTNLRLRIGDTNIRPETTNSYDCGTSTQQWNNLYAKTIYENGTSLANTYLGKTAQASDSAKLNNQNPSYYLDYNNFNNTPTIPTVNNGTLTIQRNGTQVATFTANQSSNSTANISVPTTLDDISDGSTRTLITSVNNVTPSSGNVSLTAANIPMESGLVSLSVKAVVDNNTTAIGNLQARPSSYVIDTTATGTNVQNSSFNVSTNPLYISIDKSTLSSYKLKITQADNTVAEISFANLVVGDKINVSDTGVPDRYLAASYDGLGDLRVFQFNSIETGATGISAVYRHDIVLDSNDSSYPSLVFAVYSTKSTAMTPLESLKALFRTSGFSKNSYYRSNVPLKIVWNYGDYVVVSNTCYMQATGMAKAGMLDTFKLIYTNDDCGIFIDMMNNTMSIQSMDVPAKALSYYTITDNIYEI